MSGNVKGRFHLVLQSGSPYRTPCTEHDAMAVEDLIVLEMDFDITCGFVIEPATDKSHEVIWVLEQSHHTTKGPRCGKIVAPTRRCVWPCLLPLVQGLIVSTATKSLESTSQFEIDLVDLAGKHTKVVELDTVGGLLPNGGVLRNDNSVVFCSLCPKPYLADSCLTSVDASTGKIQFQQHYALVIDNIGFDKVTNQTFINGYNQTTKHNYVFELRNQTLREVIELPGLIEVAINAYSSSKHVFFLTVQVEEPEFGNNVLAVSTVGQGKVLSNVWVDLGIEAMVYDDTFGVLYAWGADSTYAGILMSLDYTTGKPIKTFFQSPVLSANGGTATINKEGTVMYSSLLLYKQDNRPVFHALELSSGNATQVPTDLYLLSMSFQ